MQQSMTTEDVDRVTVENQELRLIISEMETELAAAKAKVAHMGQQLARSLEDGLAWRARAEHLRAELDTAEAVARE